MSSDTIKRVKAIADGDWRGLDLSDQSYGDSWRKRGGVGAFMMLARKWDRLELQVEKHGYDVFQAVFKDSRDEGIVDDIRDLRRYLLLVEGWCQMELEKLSNDGTIDPEEDT